MQALDTIASPEIIREGTNFADRFGWEALAIIVLLIFTLVFVWRYGGKVMDALVDFIQETKSQIVQLTALEAKQAESFADLARSMASLSSAQTECLKHCKLSNDHLKVVISVIKSCVQALIAALPDDKDELKTRLKHVLEELKV